MQLSSAIRVIASWSPFDQMSRPLQAQLAEQLQPLQLRPGQKLHDFESLPPGIVLVAQGQLRLLAQDSEGQPFTIERLGAGRTAGALSLLRGVAQFALAAAERTQLWLLPAAAFLHAIQQEPELLTSFSRPSLEELYGVVALSPEPRLPAPPVLLLWAANQLAERAQAQKVILLPPGRHVIPAGSGDWLVSGANVEGLQPGAEVASAQTLTVLGKLPARLVSRPNPWPPGALPAALVVGRNGEAPGEGPSEALEPEWIEQPGAIVPLQQQDEALEDWYGRLDRDGSYPHLRGDGELEESLACLRMLARHFDLPFRRDVLRRVLADQLQRQQGDAAQGLGPLQMAALCDLMGLRASPLQLRPEQLPRLEVPALCWLEGHPRLIWTIGERGALVSDPRAEQQQLPLSQLGSPTPEGLLVVLSVSRSNASPRSRFGLRWFVPALKQHKLILAQVLIASFFVQLFALLNPLLIQQIIDAVITQGNLSSLNVLGTLLVGLAVAQAVLGSLRTYLFSDTTNRIDISLGSAIIDHLLRLPLGYFARRPVGEVSSRLNELEKVRRFLTGTALTVVLDALFSLIYIAVMLLYSVQLTLWALAVVPLFIGLTAVSAPVIRQQLRDQAEANARVQSHLVETLGGMETVKGQGMELHSRWRWQQLYGGQIQAGFRNTVTSTAAGSASRFLEQLSGLLVLWVGATLVLKGELSLGQLIAFRILAGYVTNPMLRLATLWQSFQETSLSLERLADIVDHPEEIEIAGEQLPPLPPLQGHIGYEGVNFRFGSQGPLQLTNINLEIPAGSFVGIVGSSGSGKSTLLKLLTRLYDPTAGVIRVDGYDIAKVDLYSLRSQIGVVPQDSLLFDGSVMANLALTRPDAGFEEICQAAQVACAHDFIQALPAGYSSSVGERGAALSGGQRQRIAIARMVLKRPRLLILDEATSALDVDTEQQLTRNLMAAYKGSTVLFITHRLGALRHADRILVMHQGQLVEQGHHDELIALGGRYATLFHQQEAALA
jgi:ATP-binding cassette, subfamily B, bacterial HlyB/CyaB